MKSILLVALVLLAATPVLATETTADTRPSLVEAAKADGRFQTLVAALDRADLVGALAGEGPFTVFAPTDEAFAALPDGVLARLLTPAGKEDLQRILANHVVPARVRSTDLLSTKSAATLAGTKLPIRLRVGDANVIQADVLCRNGVIHVIDRVLVPSAAPARASKPSMDAIAMIHGAIDKGVPLFNEGHIEQCAKVYDEVAAKLVASKDALGAWDRMDLREARAKPAHDASEKAWTLRYSFDRILANDAFEPRMEAALPEGFPKPGPVGRIVRKSYPQYRAARAEGGAAFWTLFNHIKTNKVEMTTPVEMTLDGKGRMRDMAFLYERPTQGASGNQGRVAVLDLEPTQVLSIGLRGRRGGDMITKAKKLMTAYMAEHGIEAAGEWRVLGYNSPMVPAAQQFWELQVPIRP